MCMPTTDVTHDPEAQHEQQEAEQRDTSPASPPQPQQDSAVQRTGETGTEIDSPQGDRPQQQVMPPIPVPSGNEVDLRVAALKVDELKLELQATVGLDRLDLEAKGLEAELYLGANLGNVVALVDAAAKRTPPIVESVGRTVHDDDGREELGSGSAAPAGLSGELATALESARTAYERVAAPELREELHEAYDTVRTAYQRVAGDNKGPRPGDGRSEDDDGGEESGGAVKRVTRFVRSPAAAATAGVAGAAVGALAGSKGHRNRHRLLDRLPGRDRSVTAQLVDRAAGVPGEVMKAVRERVG
jgi:hypothetical protein